MTYSNYSQLYKHVPVIIYTRLAGDDSVTISDGQLFN